MAISESKLKVSAHTQFANTGRSYLSVGPYTLCYQPVHGWFES